MLFLAYTLSFLVLLLSFLQLTIAVLSSDSHQNFDQFKYCIRQAKHPNLRECIGRTALNFLQRVDEMDNYTLTHGFVAARDENIASRSLVNFLDTDPVDFRGIMENAGAVFSQRNLEFHMDTLYPGLMLKVGPSADAKSLVEFVLDPTVDERNFGYEEPTTARILAKQYLVPFLLGLKFNLVALVPLIFGIICLLLKKSLFLAKLAVFVSSALGIGGAIGTLGSLGGFGGIFPGFGGVLANGHPHALGVSAAAAAGIGPGGGYFPGKATVYNQYDEDEFHHNSPYKRTDRKINFNKPREQVSPMESTALPSDRFYDYEKQVTIQDHSGKMRSSKTGGMLGPSAAYSEAEVAEQVDHNFMTSDRTGWTAIDVRSLK